MKIPYAVYNCVVDNLYGGREYMLLSHLNGANRHQIIIFSSTFLYLEEY